MDNDRNLWVLCDGGIQETFGGLFKVDRETFEILNSWVFPQKSMDASSLFYDKVNDEVSFILSATGSGLNAYHLVIVEDQIPPTVSMFEIPDVPYLFSHYVLDNGQMLIGEASAQIENGRFHVYDEVSNKIVETYEAVSSISDY